MIVIQVIVTLTHAAHFSVYIFDSVTFFFWTHNFAFRSRSQANDKVKAVNR